MRQTINTLKKLNVLIAMGLFFVTVSAGNLHAATDVYTMKIGTAPVNDLQHEWMKRFKVRAEKRSKGRLEVKLFPGGQIGSVPRMIEGLQLGTVEALVAPANFLSGIDIRNSVLAAPGLFNSVDHCWQVAGDQAFRDVLFPLMSDKGIVAISMLCYAPQAFLTKKKISTLDDLKGLKIRVLASDMEVKPMQAIGINPTPMPLGEVLPSMQRGLIDGVSSLPIIFSKLKMLDAAKNITMTKLYYITAPVYVSKPWFDTLPDDLKKIIVDESREIEKELVDWNNEMNAGVLADWEKNGGTVSELPANDQAEIVSTARTAAEKVIASETELRSMYNKLSAISERY